MAPGTRPYAHASSPRLERDLQTGRQEALLDPVEHAGALAQLGAQAHQRLVAAEDAHGGHARHAPQRAGQVVARRRGDVVAQERHQLRGGREAARDQE